MHNKIDKNPELLIVLSLTVTAQDHYTITTELNQ